MSEATFKAAGDDLESLSRVARTLQPVQPHERRGVLRDEAGFLLDGLLVRVARGRGALDLAIGDGLASLTVGDRLLRLGFSGLGDYSRERLGIAGSTAVKLERLARNLAGRPQLRQAVVSGAVSARKAETIVAVARGDDEAAWVARARVETVRSLAAGVKEALGDGGDEAEDEERWERVSIAMLRRGPGQFGAPGSAAQPGSLGSLGQPGGSGLPGGPAQPGAQEKLDEALAIAGKLLGAGAPKWQRLEALCEEYLGAHPPPVGDGQVPPSPPAGDVEAPHRPFQLFDHGPYGLPLEELKAWLEKEHHRWAFLTRFDPAPRPVPGGEEAVEAQAGGPVAGESDANGRAQGDRAASDTLAVASRAVGPAADGRASGDPSSVPANTPSLDLARLDADLRRLRDLRSRWDELLGHLAMLLRQLGLWRDMQFVSFAHYCAERLGMSARAVEQRATLERRLYWLPALRAALRDGRVSYEKARVVAARATEATLDAWLERAQQLPCIALSRQAEAEEDRQMCARGQRCFRLPVRLVALLDAALRAAKAGAGRFISSGEALERIAEHFIATWKPLLAERNTVQQRVLDRDRGWCQVPGCSRAALHVHHLTYRSHGGDDRPDNLVGLCAAHHLHGIHAGYLRVTGQAPHRLRWTFRPGGGPFVGPARRQATEPVAARAVA